MIRSSRRSVLATLAFAFVTACGGSDGGTGPGATFEQIAANYQGAITGLNQGVQMQVLFGLNLTQNSGQLGGTWQLAGTLRDNVSSLPVSGSGTISGTIASGNNPSVNITIKTPLCPNYSAAFSGSYDVANRRITITGPVEFFANNSCNVALSYSPTTIILNR